MRNTLVEVSINFNSAGCGIKTGYFSGNGIYCILTDVVIPEEKKESTPKLFLKCLQISRNASIPAV